MARTRSEAIADAIAKRIMANRTKKRFSTLHAEALEEIYKMPTPTSSTLNGPGTGQPRVSTQTTDEATVASEGTKASAANGSVGKDNVTSGMSVSSQVTVGPVKETSARTLEGSHGSDDTVRKVSADFSTDFAKNPPKPREQMRGQQNSRNYKEDGTGSFLSEHASPDSDAGV